VTPTTAQSSTEEWNEELQVNYNIPLLTLTSGGLYFHQRDIAGGPPGEVNTPAFLVVPASGRVPLGDEQTSYNKADSLAAYTQAEVHVLPKVDLVAGGRATHDKKSGD
jgi:iron complex outermembrane receptor protein